MKSSHFFGKAGKKRFKTQGETCLQRGRKPHPAHALLRRLKPTPCGPAGGRMATGPPERVGLAGQDEGERCISPEESPPLLREAHTGSPSEMCISGRRDMRAGGSSRGPIHVLSLITRPVLSILLSWPRLCSQACFFALPTSFSMSTFHPVLARDCLTHKPFSACPQPTRLPSSLERGVSADACSFLTPHLAAGKVAFVYQRDALYNYRWA